MKPKSKINTYFIKGHIKQLFPFWQKSNEGEWWHRVFEVSEIVRGHSPKDCVKKLGNESIEKYVSLRTIDNIDKEKCVFVLEDIRKL